MRKEDLDEIFTYHAPSIRQVGVYQELRDTAKQLAYIINDLCPDSREKSLAITNLQQTIMFANASIAIHTKE